MMRTLGQALRNAIEIEHSAARFYLRLVDRAADDDTRAFLADMAAQEEAHARSLEHLADEIAAGKLPASVDDRIDNVETAPGWACAEDVSFDLRQALSLAVEAEISAALYYDAMADHSTGEVAAFFTRLTGTEQEHAERIRKRLEKLPD